MRVRKSGWQQGRRCCGERWSAAGNLQMTTLNSSPANPATSLALLACTQRWPGGGGAGSTGAVGTMPSAPRMRHTAARMPSGSSCSCVTTLQRWGVGLSVACLPVREIACDHIHQPNAAAALRDCCT